MSGGGGLESAVREAPLLHGVRVVSVAYNLPGPAAAARLGQLGAHVTKVEPPSGDPAEELAPAWYRSLTAGQEVVRLDLKEPEGRRALEEHLARADLFITSNRPSSLARLGLDPESVGRRHPRLCRVAIVGYPPPDEERAGHDLSYQGSVGLLDPPSPPRTLLADLAGAERTVSQSLALLLARERTGEANFSRVSLAEAVRPFADPLHHGLTAPGGPLGGGFAGYDLYPAGEGWVAVAALEPRFRERLREELGVEALEREALERAFQERTAEEWERWARERDLPVTRVRAP